MKLYTMIVLAIYIFLGFLIFSAGLYWGKRHGIPFLKKEREYAIGIYTGTSPFRLTSPSHIVNPVLRPRDVIDVPAEFVADPFMVKENKLWYMFFEVMNTRTQKGEIGLAVSSDGFRWTYKQIVLDETFHLSYPYVFKWNGNFYMVPESCLNYDVRLYKAIIFPTKWMFVKTLLKGNYFDSSLLHYDGKWWLFTSDRNDILHLFYAYDLIGIWEEHPLSPVIFGNAKIARPGGRVLLCDGRVYRFTQDCEHKYGYQVRAFEITKLTTEEYQECKVPENPILKPSGKGWNAETMHHIDLHEISTNSWIACVDGIGGNWKFKIK